MFEHDHRASAYSLKEMKLMHNMCLVCQNSEFQTYPSGLSHHEKLPLKPSLLKDLLQLFTLALGEVQKWLSSV